MSNPKPPALLSLSRAPILSERKFCRLDRWQQPVQWFAARRQNLLLLPIAVASPVYLITGCCRFLSRPSEASQAKFSSHPGLDAGLLFLSSGGSILFAHSGSILLTINNWRIPCLHDQYSPGNTGSVKT